MWLTLAFFSSLFLGLDEVAKKSALKDNAVIPVLALSILLSAALFLPLQLVSVFSPDTLLDTAFYIPPVSADAHWGILLKAAIVLGSWIFGFFATKHLPLTISSSVKASRPVFVVLGAILIFGERLNFSQWAGVIVVLTALVVLSNLDKRDGRDDREPPRPATSRRSGNRPTAFFGAASMLWVYFLIASTLLGAASALWDKFLIVRYDRLAIQAYTCYYQSLMMIVIVLLMWYPKRKQTTPLQWRWTIFLTGFLLTVSDFLYFYALSDPEALLSVLSPIRRSGVVFTFVVGAILFHERQIKVKAAILAVVLAGTMLLYFG